MSISYKLRKNPTYGDHRDIIVDLVESNPGQMSFDEYTYIYDLIESNAGCNLLIFGLGRDSGLWLNTNTGGKTIFLEDNVDWINTIEHAFKLSGNNIDIRHIVYNDTGHDSNKLLEDYKLGNTGNLKLDLPDDVRNIDWDIIIVDAPAGYSNDVPCRMKSIYESYNLSEAVKGIHIIVHDAQRKIESLYTDYFFQSYNLIETLDDGEHGVLKHFKR
tara:strand:+ start:210 stop:857 length:648 start_codon:yes stop_codon:yes gene_type:complete